MKKLQVLGPGCPKCEELEKVTGLKDIMALGVFITPALVVEGEVKITGQVPSVEEIKKLIT
jgi:hypothetical protein